MQNFLFIWPFWQECVKGEYLTNSPCQRKLALFVSAVSERVHENEYLTWSHQVRFFSFGLFCKKACKIGISNFPHATVSCLRLAISANSVISAAMHPRSNEYLYLPHASCFFFSLSFVHLSKYTWQMSIASSRQMNVWSLCLVVSARVHEMWVSNSDEASSLRLAIQQECTEADYKLLSRSVIGHLNNSAWKIKNIFS